MAVTIQQIADAAGVSRGTVDRALNHRGRIAPEVADRIYRIAEEMGYVHRARKKNAGRKRKIGVVTQLCKSSFMLEINRGIREAGEELKHRGIELLIEERESVDENEQLDAIDRLVEQGICALAVMPVDCELIRTRLNSLAVEKNLPIVTFNSDIVGTKRLCFVGMDNHRSGQTAAGLLRMLTGGEGKVLIITGHFSSALNNQRVDGFVEEAKRICPNLQIAGVQASFNDTREVEKIIENALLNISGINAVFSVSGGQGGIGQAFEKLRLEKRPFVVIYDQTPKNEKIIESELADFLIDQNGFEQGYRPPFLLANYLMKGQLPETEFMYTDIVIKTKYNL
ncbi:LacI family DNA-binding transcriptional regulator [Acetatifactor muris]|uniref:Putative HTH-type transcriptional repressor ExuR n=1 Tax=Acetatifactor muris TaxID=879566 RepID=A0A2K4ZPZ8_9FIRM|nr:LacI family DNA-binding transcriptional regulator [Acetatifactor muris]MCR2051018.1 LacI family DNA-binding transcriptional regulator [Acetatifactor muris]SOY32574.1 putative HTH-type transcriptional repressor ExuR [Acetatifactor muris]